MTSQKMSWDDRLLFAPLHTLSARSRTFVVAACTLLALGWCTWRNGDLRSAWTLPDVKFYVFMAQGRYDLVPAPFSARPLAPLLAHALSALLHSSPETGFAILAFLSLLFALAAVFWLGARTGAPRWILLLLAAVPFWPQLLGDAGLPDALYTALLAALLLALQAESLYLAAALMLPLMLTRESTWLTLFCLLLVGWPRLRWPQTLLALVSAAAGALLVHHLSAGSLPNLEHLSSGLYMAGKLVSNTARSFGIAPWSNVYTEMCGTPIWQQTLHFGPVRGIGVCGFSSEDPFEVIAALFTVFGALPAVAIALWAARRAPRRSLSLLTRFCLLYGGISFLLAPGLGTWYTRLFGYSWPLFLVALPRLLEALPRPQPNPARAHHSPALWGLLVVLHLLIFTEGQQLLAPRILFLFAALEIAWVALFLVQNQHSPESSLPA